MASTSDTPAEKRRLQLQPHRSGVLVQALQPACIQVFAVLASFTSRLLLCITTDGMPGSETVEIDAPGPVVVPTGTSLPTPASAALPTPAPASPIRPAAPVQRPSPSRMVSSPVPQGFAASSRRAAPGAAAYLPGARVDAAITTFSDLESITDASRMVSMRARYAYARCVVEARCVVDARCLVHVFVRVVHVGAVETVGPKQTLHQALLLSDSTGAMQTLSLWIRTAIIACRELNAGQVVDLSGCEAVMRLPGELTYGQYGLVKLKAAPSFSVRYDGVCVVVLPCCRIPRTHCAFALQPCVWP